ncbi:MAG: type II secretion system protein [Oligoflexales bacterium]
MKKKSSQAGYTLIEILIAISILGITLAGMVSGVTKLIEQSYNRIDTSMVFEDDLIVRYELTRALQIFQREVVKRLPSGSRTEANVKNFQCSDPWDLMKSIQTGTFLDLPVGSRRIYFGEWQDLLSIIPQSTQIMASQNRLFQAEGRFDQVLGSSPTQLFAQPKYPESRKTLEAYKRCTKQSINASTNNIQSKDTIYMCGFGVGFIVEIQATFWDANNKSALRCDSMNGVSGRGIQAIYKVYAFSRSLHRKATNPDSSGFIFKSYGGRVYIPKDIWNG